MRWRILSSMVLLVALVAPPAHALEPNDVAYADGLQWSLELIGAAEAWDVATGDGITIAIVDSGIDLDHEDLPAGRIADSIACFGTGGDPGRCKGSAQDDHGHGTHVAGIAAAATNNGRGVAGTAPGADLLIVKVLEERCDALGCTASGTSSDVSAGIRWAADRGADVINLSLGSTTSALLGSSFATAIQYAWDRGAIPVVAAGNDYILGSGFADEPALVVSATNRDDAAASYSNGVGEARWGIAAPGGEGETDPDECRTGGAPEGVLSTYWLEGRSDQYACLAGTSMAAPHVSGALAVLLSHGLGPAEAVQRLLTTAVDLGRAGPDATFGAGRIDLGAAVAGGPVTTPTTQAGGGGPGADTAGDSSTTTTTTSGEPVTPPGDAVIVDGGPDPTPSTTDGAAGTAEGDGGDGSATREPGASDAALGDLSIGVDGPSGRASTGLKVVAGGLAAIVTAGGIVVRRRGLDPFS